jgi:hypothetical protein
LVILVIISNSHPSLQTSLNGIEACLIEDGLTETTTTTMMKRERERERERKSEGDYCREKSFSQAWVVNAQI